MRTASAARLRLGVLATHPIQYQVPMFRALAGRSDIQIDVAYLEIPDATRQGRGFGVAFQWDVPLLDGYPWRMMPTRPLARAGFARTRLLQPRRSLAQWEIDALLLTGWQCLPLVQALIAAKRLRLPVLMRGESNSLRRRGPVVRWLHRRLLKRVDAFLAIGGANRAFYNGYGVSDERIHDAPYFVDNLWFSERADELRRERARLRAGLGVPLDAVCFLFAGKFERKKHPHHALEGIARLQGLSGCPVHLLMVGAGDLYDSLRGWAEGHRAPVSFTGFLNQGQMPQAYAAADALVLPSDFGETWGLVVNEAMACGLPAIVSDQVGCAADLVRDGVTGWRYPFGDLDALTSRMATMASDRSATAAMGAAARLQVEQRFTVERSAGAVVAAARTAVADRQP